MKKPMHHIAITRDNVFRRHVMPFCAIFLLLAFTQNDAAYSKRLAPRTGVCVAGLKHQEDNAGLFQGELQLEVRKDPDWEEWDAKFSDVVINDVKAINLKQNKNSSKLHFLLVPSSSAKRTWLHIMVGLGVWTTVGKKICKGGTFRFPMSQDPVSAAKSIMAEMFGAGGQFPPCKEEWFEVN